MLKLSVTLDKIIEHIQNNWHTKISLILSIFVASILEISLLIYSKVDLNFSIVIIFVSVILLIGTWLYAKKIPTTRKGKIGFVVCIACSTDDEEKKIREDFIIPLRQLIATGQTGAAFYFIEIPQYVARTVIVPDDANELRLKCKAHFVLYGRVRLRELNGVMQHFIDLDGVVTHRPITKKVSKSFSDEFAELLPRKIGIPTENDLLTFHFTSEWAIIVAKYVIGIAASYSGDLDYAESLYIDSLEQLQTKDHGFPVYAKLIQRIPKRISELYEARAQVSYLRWSKEHQLSDIQQLEKNLSRIDVSRQMQPRVLNLRAIDLFISKRDAKGALRILKQSSEKNSAVWHLNVAFLFAYSCDLKNALRHYKKAITFPIDSATISQIEDFICVIIEDEPKKYQLYFSLGYFNWKVKGDKKQAIKDFRKFLSSGSDSEFVSDKELVRSWLTTLKTESDS